MTSAEWLALKASRNANGQCLCCGRNERVTKTVCSHCRVSIITTQKHRRARRTAANLCIDCPDTATLPATNGTLRCDHHRTVVGEQQRNYRKRLRGMAV